MVCPSRSGPPAPGEKHCYTYDFGDNWEHTLTVESVRPATDDDAPGRWVAAPARRRRSAAYINLAISLVGATPDEEIRRFEAVDPGFPLPEPGPELAELLGRCRPILVDQIGGIVARAMTLAEDPTDEELDRTVQPWQTMLEVIGPDGPRLSPAGWMPPAAVQEIRRTSGVARGIGKGNREDLTPEVALLREECVQAGLVRKQKGRLLLTKLGQRCHVSRTTLFEAVARSLVRAKYDVEQDIRVITLLFIAARWQIGWTDADVPQAFG